MSLAWLVEVGIISILCDSTQRGLFQTIGFGLLLFRAYSTWRDSLSTPILSALLRQYAAPCFVFTIPTDSTTVALLTMALFFVRATIFEATRHNNPSSGINIYDRLDGNSASLSSDV
jgi:hypothetical protein